MAFAVLLIMDLMNHVLIALAAIFTAAAAMELIRSRFAVCGSLSSADILMSRALLPVAFLISLFLIGLGCSFLQKELGTWSVSAVLLSYSIVMVGAWAWRNPMSQLPLFEKSGYLMKIG